MISENTIPSHPENKYKIEARRVQCNSWVYFCNNIEDASEAPRLRNNLGSPSYTIEYYKESEDSWTTSSKESLELLFAKPNALRSKRATTPWWFS